MKILAIAFALMYFATIFVAQDAFSATAKKSKKRLSTDLNFTDHSVSGKYNFSTEAITTVENDKSLDDLIGVRKNFKDRIDRSESLR